MKFKKLLVILCAFPLVACGAKKALVIPTVDVDKLKITLPDIPNRNTGAIRTSDGFDYIDLYELSDFHGAVYTEKGSSVNIGLARLATYLDNRRSENQGGTIVLSSGDMFQGSADSNLTRGYMVNYSMQYMGFDAMAVGNHEFDWGETWLKKNANLKYKTSTMPFLGANILKNNAMPSYLKKSTVISRDDYKIGVIGVIGSELENSVLKTAIKDFEFSKYKELVSTESERLRTEEGCNAVVLLAHEAGDVVDVPANIDAVFGGHAHNDYAEHPSNYAVCATKNYGRSIAHISLKFDSSTNEYVGIGQYEVTPFTSSDASLAEESNVKKIINQYAPEINKIKNIKLAKCDDVLEASDELVSIATSSMYEAVVDVADTIKELKVNSKKIVAAFTNVSGGIRADIAKGEITYGDVYKSFPFDNELVLFTAKGSTLKSTLYTLSNLGCYRIFEELSYLTDNETYYICTTDYVALSNMMSGVKKLEDKDLIRTGRVLREEVANKIYKLDNIKAEKWSLLNLDYHYEPIL